MKFLRFHKFLCKYDKSNQRCRTDIYLNPEKVTWVEEVFDDGRCHACIYLSGDDFVNVFEQVSEVVRTLENGNQFLPKEKVENAMKPEEQKTEVTVETPRDTSKETVSDSPQKKVRKPRKRKIEKNDVQVTSDAQCQISSATEEKSLETLDKPSPL